LHGNQHLRRDTAWATSEENVDRFRNATDAFNRCDDPGSYERVDYRNIPREEEPMRALVASAALALVMMAALASSAFARTSGNFPAGVTPPACAVLGSNPAAMGNPPVMPAQAKNPPNPSSGLDGSDNGFFNKVDLFTDACL
jgi:hypothetical protein